MIIDVPNTPPSYQGDNNLTMSVEGLVSLNTVAKGFRDVEGDSYKFGLATQPEPPLWLIVNQDTGIISAIMISDYQGSYLVNITATDSCGDNTACGKVGWQLFNVTVPNRQPYFQFDLTAPSIIQLGTTERFQYTVLSDTVLDPDGDKILWSVRLADGGDLPTGLSFNAVTRMLSGLPTAGVYNVTLVASDGYGGTVNQTIVLRVNSQPVANRTDVLVMLPGIHQSFAWKLPADLLVDADGDVISYRLVRTNPEYLVPTWLSFNGTVLSGTPTANNHQPVQLLLEGKDPFGGVGQIPLALTIDNLSPVAQVALPSPDTLQVGEELSYTLPRDAFLDHEGDSLQSRALLLSDDGHLPGFLSFNPITRTLSGMTTPTSAGRHRVVFQVADGHGGFANSSVVEFHINTPPTAATQPWSITSLPVGQAFSSELPIDFMIDADGDRLIYSLVRTNPEGAAFI